MDKLKYTSTERYYEGIIIEITDASVMIDLEGRLGQLRLPKRMLISENNLEEGQKVGFLMTYPEVVDESIDKDYLHFSREQLKKRRDRGDKI